MSKYFHGIYGPIWVRCNKINYNIFLYNFFNDWDLISLFLSFMKNVELNLDRLKKLHIFLTPMLSWKFVKNNQIMLIRKWNASLTHGFELMRQFQLIFGYILLGFDSYTTPSQQPLTWGWAPMCGVHPHVRGCCVVVVLVL
jgi:hypothetical protein